MTLGYITLVYALPITAGCGSLIALNHWGIVRCLQAMSGALWAASKAIEAGRVEYRKQFDKLMEVR